MKKLILTLLLAFTISVTLNSCKGEKKADPEKKEIATKLYQCPMDCEKGKSYTEPGKCPVCNMDLKEKSASDKHEHKDGETHNH